MRRFNLHGWVNREGITARLSLFPATCPRPVAAPSNMPQISQEELGGDVERPNPIQQQGGEQVTLGVNCGAGNLYEHPQVDKGESGSEGCLYMHQRASTRMFDLQRKFLQQQVQLYNDSYNNRWC